MKLMDSNQTPGFNCDVAEPNQVKDSVDQLVSKYGRIDVLANNAGIATFTQILETSFKEWSRILAVNLNGPFIFTQECAPVMLENGGGRIVKIAPISSFLASKVELMQLTKQRTAELGNLGIRVNACAPGPVDTAMAKKVHTPDIETAYRVAIPLNRYGLEVEIEEVVWFLCSDTPATSKDRILPLTKASTTAASVCPTSQHGVNQTPV